MILLISFLISHFLNFIFRRACCIWALPKTKQASLFGDACMLVFKCYSLIMSVTMAVASATTVSMTIITVIAMSAVATLSIPASLLAVISLPVYTLSSD